MESQFLFSPTGILQKLVAQASGCESWSFCSSWADADGGSAEVWRQLHPFFPKLDHAIVGLALHQTEPWVLRELHRYGILRAVVSADGSFHPKVYAFRSPESYSALVGSANFAVGSFGANQEAVVLTTCDPDHAFAHAVETFLEKCRNQARLLTLHELDWYEREANLRAELLDQLSLVNLRPTQPPAEPAESDMRVAEKVNEDNDVDLIHKLVNDFVNESVINNAKKKALAEASEEESSETDNRQDSAPLPERPKPEDIEPDEVMAAFRKASRGRGEMEQDELLKEVSQRLGYRRLGSTVSEVLKGHLMAAIRRRIIARDRGLLFAETPSIADYSRQELVKTLFSVMGNGWYEREDLIRGAARYLGFNRVTDTIRDAIKSAINSAIRRGTMTSEGNSWVRRVD